MLPDKVYEALRWIVAVFLPALGVFFPTLAEAWHWNLPTEAIPYNLVGFGALSRRYFRYF